MTSLIWLITSPAVAPLPRSLCSPHQTVFPVSLLIDDEESQNKHLDGPRNNMAPFFKLKSSGGASPWVTISVRRRFPPSVSSSSRFPRFTTTECRLLSSDECCHGNQEANPAILVVFLTTIMIGLSTASFGLCACVELSAQAPT